ncbi:MAG: hypothetical protein HYZ90_05090 [Candidatus Omnitrophica bacterium]|nr:hypothetical protein [Candidatus Omnitrophota bacterium]
MLASWVAIATGLILLRMAKGMTFMAGSTDAEKQVRGAAHSPRWVWPSDMHRYIQGKALMKDAGVLGLALFQRLLGDVKSVFPLTALCALAHSVSAALIFFVAKGYWGAEVGWFLFALFLSSFWPYQVVLMEGLQGLAQMFLLASVLCLQQSSSGPLWTVLAGVGAGLMMFSSASARKLVPLALGAFLFAHRGEITLPEGMGKGMVWLFLLASLFFLLKLKARRSPKRQPTVSQRLRRSAKELGLMGLLLALLPVLLARSRSFLLAEFLMGGGIFLAVLFFTAPNFLANLKGYITYWNSQQLYCHFPLYRDYFARIGRPIPEGMRGGGFPWVLRFFRLSAPFHGILFGFAWVFLIGKTAARGFVPQELLSLLGLLLLSLSPVLVGELTGSAQVGRAYLPAFLGILLMIGEASFEWRQALAPERGWIFWAGAVPFLWFCAAWNLRVFLSDIWPSRMAPAWAAQRLLKLRPGPFCTYETPYNHSLVGAFPEPIRSQLSIRSIRTLEEAKEGYLIVPGTSAKALTMESEAYAIRHGDFKEDPLLTGLLDSKEIERYAVASFKTLGSSRYWVQESDVASYRSLILREITEEDRWRARAWILDAGKLAKGMSLPLPAGAGSAC